MTYRTYVSKIYTSLADGRVHWSDATGRFGTLSQKTYCWGYNIGTLPERRTERKTAPKRREGDRF